MHAAGDSTTILGLSDTKVPLVDSPQIAETFNLVDLVVACGDLPIDYLEYALTALNKPLVYVPGNHDPDDFTVPGGDAVDGCLRQVKGVSILGFGGSVRYKSEGRHQYTQGEMASRFIPFLPRLLVRRMIRGSGLDLLVAHAPPFGIHDQPDPAHRGFKIFRWILPIIRPNYMLHGHIHAAANISTTETLFAGCRVINVFPYRLITIHNS